MWQQFKGGVYTLYLTHTCALVHVHYLDLNDSTAQYREVERGLPTDG